LSLCLIVKHYAMKAWGSGGTAPFFLTSALDGGECSASRPCRFTPGERARGIHWIGGWVGPRAGLDTLEKRKYYHCRESKPGLPARSPSEVRDVLEESRRLVVPRISCLRLILILSSNLLLGIPSSLLPSGFPEEKMSGTNTNPWSNDSVVSGIPLLKFNFSCISITISLHSL
jgi:hypothetical protein